MLCKLISAIFSTKPLLQWARVCDKLYFKSLKGSLHMKILGIDSSGMVASAALVEDAVTLSACSVNHRKTHSETLLPMVDEVLRVAECTLADVDAIAVAAGPGSFTGLRIGAATAKGLGFAAEKPLIAVPTLAALAYNLWGTGHLVCPIMDARRNQVYTGIYAFPKLIGNPVDATAAKEEATAVPEADAAAAKEEVAALPEADATAAKEETSADASGNAELLPGGMELLFGDLACDIHELADQINALKRPVIFTGDGCPVFRTILDEICRVPHFFAPAHMNRQRAEAVAALGVYYHAAGLFCSADEMKPYYLRKSQAEREREAKE